MSDNWIILIPQNPHEIPDEKNRMKALLHLRRIMPDAEEIELKVCDTLEFFDSGANFECVRCPSCHSELQLDWWQDRMDEDFQGGFRLNAYRLPCCQARRTLNELDYDWPQGFGRFAIEVMNPGTDSITDEQKHELEAILGTSLRVIQRHL